MRVKRQMSDTLLIGASLATVGGFLDAYTYLCRGKVFSNAQTGNIVLMGIHFMEGNFIKVLYYLLPIFAFFVGIIISEMVRKRFIRSKKIHWRQIILVIELLVLIIVAFLPVGKLNMLCNIAISFVCSLQIQSFRKFHNNPYVSTLCTGNLRTATEHLYTYTQTHEKKTLLKSLDYYMIILFFIIGACLGAIFTQWLLGYAVLISALLLLSLIIFMFIKEEG